MKIMQAHYDVTVKSNKKSITKNCVKQKTEMIKIAGARAADCKRGVVVL